MMHNLIAVDLDGTLLTNEKKVTQTTTAEINRCISQGCLFVPVTGRPLFGIPEEVAVLARNSFVVTMNGAEVFSMPDTKCVFSSLLKSDVAVELLECAEKFSKLGVELFCGGYGYVTEKYYREVLKDFANSPMYKYYSQSRKHVADSLCNFAEGRKDIAEVACFCVDKNEMDSFCTSIENTKGVKIIRTAPEYVEIISEKTDKGTALEYIANLAGFTRDEVVAFGDGHNDISMLEYAGKSVAMKNAFDEVKSAAKFVTDTNEKNGVAVWLSVNCN